jgi:hypothetical protein
MIRRLLSHWYTLVMAALLAGGALWLLAWLVVNLFS